MVRALDPASVIAGEAVSGTPEERWNDMVAIASVIANRAAALGVTPQQVIANTNEFNAYNRQMPAGTPQLVDMAQEALNYVEENGPINNATFYATPAATDNLPSGLLAEGATTGHQYFSDPQNRAIGTSLGYRQPNQYAYAANPENVPTPDQPSLMGATGAIGQGGVPVVAVPQGFEQPDPLAAPTGLLGTAPAPSGFAEMAAAGPMGLLSTPNISQPSGTALNGFSDLAAAGPLGGQFASPADRMGLLSAPSISQADISRALSNPTSQGMDPGFTAGLMGPNNPVVPTAVETSSYTQPTAMASADLGSFPTAMAAQRQPVGTGIYSPEHLAVQAQAEKQLAASRAVPSGLLSSYTAPTSITPAEQAIQGITSQTPAALGSFPSALAAQREMPGYHLSDLDGVTMVPNAIETAPALETVSIPDQPTVAAQPTIEGPSTTPAVSQQAQMAAGAKAATQTLGDKLKASFNPGTAIGGILGGATLGPIGGILGGLLGNAINNGGLSGMSGLLGNQAPTMNTIGVGPAAAYGIYGGGYAPGSTAIASDGSRVSAQAGGDVARTNSFGVTDVANSYGGYAGDFSGWY
jgi:hypothetical protein